jgi:hypothetical protein
MGNFVFKPKQTSPKCDVSSTPKKKKTKRLRSMSEKAQLQAQYEDYDRFY